MNRHGFTLVEVIVSAVILAVAVGLLLQVFSTESGVLDRTGRRMQAMDFARQKLEELKNAVDAQTWPNTGDLAAGVGIAATLPDSELKDKFSGTRTYTVTNMDIDGGGLDYKRVSVTVDWSEPSK